MISVMDALVTACVSEYTEMQPEFQELKEKFRKIAENEKEESTTREIMIAKTLAVVIVAKSLAQSVRCETTTNKLSAICKAEKSMWKI